MIRTLACALTLLTAAPAAAQVDFVRQDIVVDVTSPTLRVEIDLEVEATGPADSIWVLTPSLPVQALTVDGEPASTIPHPESPLATGIYPATALAAGERAVVRLVAAGVPSCAGATYDVCAYDAETIALFPSSPSFAWHFVNLLSDDDSYVGSIRVIAPEGLLVVAGQGAAESVNLPGDGTAEWTYPITTPEIRSFVYARAAETLELDVAGRTLLATPPPGADATTMMRIERLAQVAGEVLPIYETKFGTMPSDELHLMTVPPRFPFGGMGLLGNVFLGDFIFWDEFEYLIDQGIAHELAHSWWGNLVRATERNEGLVMQEGMAEYSAWLAQGEAWGDDVRTAGARMNSVWYMYGRPGSADVAALDPALDQSPVAIHVGYHKGAQAWRAIASAAGEDRFVEALAALVADGEHATVDELVTILDGLGYDAARDVDQWLRSTGFPVVTTSTTVDEEVCLTLALDGDFDVPMPVVLRAPDGTAAEHTVALTTGTTEACLPVTGPLAAVELDPRWTMSREVRPALTGDVTLDGTVDAADLIAVALHAGTALPAERRVDGGYDPLFDLDVDRDVDADDLTRTANEATR